MIVFSSDYSGTNGLWTIPTSGGIPEGLPVGSEDPSGGLAVSRTGNRLVYGRSLFSTNISRAGGPNLSNRNTPPAKLIASTRIDIAAQYSPDGEKIVFSSNRSGSFEIWTCDSEGHDCGQLTSFAGPSPGSPRWSPDSRSVAFDCPKAGNFRCSRASENFLTRLIALNSINQCRLDDLRHAWRRSLL